MSSTFTFQTTVSRVTRWAGQAVVLALATLVTVSSASAETLMMPKRDALKGTSMVVWGVHTQSGSPACSIDFGDATPAADCTGLDRSYVTLNHTYATSGNFIATLTVGAETATVAIQVFDGLAMTADNLRSLKVNMAIQDGLRYLWTSQANRAGDFPASVTTNWGNSYSYADAALIVLAFENHGYKLTGNAAPTGLYEKYVVRRGLNYVLSQLSQITLGVQTAGNPCVGAGTGWDGSDCIGLSTTTGDNHSGYGTSVSILPFAASGALSRVNTEVAGATANMTYGEVLQRLVNTAAWGQTDSGAGRGGWGYAHNGGQFDGSTVGWAILGFLDAEAAGATVPAFVRTEFKFGFDNALNTDGSFDYGADGSPASVNNTNPQKGGIGLQGLFFIGETGGAREGLVKTYISSWWESQKVTTQQCGWEYYWWYGWYYSCWNVTSYVPQGIGGNAWDGPPNKGSAYSMFNNFKGLKLAGVSTLPGVARAAGPGSQPAGDWYADYQDWLVTNQQSANTSGGGDWGTINFSCCYSGLPINTAIAELILSPVALVLPDEDKFAAVGLTPATNTALELTTHTVTAHADSTGGTPVPGATVNFTILTGPNAGLTGTDTTDSNGEATFTYTDQGPLGTVGVDTIQATIGALSSNTVSMTWTLLNRPPTAVDDAGSTFSGTPVTVNLLVNDGDPDFDLLTITSFTQGANGSVVDNGDGTVTYSPVAGFAGIDTFTYDIADGKGGTDTATVTIDVAKRLATVTAGGGTKVYGSADPAFTPSSAGFLPADGITVTQTARDAGETVGSYPTHATAAGDALVNYTVTYTDGALTITKATPTAETTGGTFTYDGQAHASTCTVTGVGTDVLTGVVSYAPGPGVPATQGTYEVSCEYAATDNYEAASASATITINRAVATVTAGSGTKVYGTVDPAFTPSSTGFLAADGIVVTQTPRDAGETVGSYATHATAAGAALGNYAVTYTNGSLSVTPAALTVAANSYTRSDLAADPTLTGTLTGVVAGDGITATYSSTGTGSQVPGVYPTIPTLVDSNGKLGNYTVSSTNGTLTITNTVPVCTIAPSQASIWPPNHKLVSITANGATDIDGGPLTYTVVSIFQDEPTNTTGDGNTAIDGFGVGTSTAQVRAERVGDPKTPGNGRVYHITFSVTDSLGLSCQATVQVGVPHDQSGKVQPIDGGPIYNSTVAGPAPAVAAKGKGN